MRHEENRCFRGGREVRKEMGVLGNSGDWETGVSGETGKIRGGVSGETGGSWETIGSVEAGGSGGQEI